jgi:hypothetical protein
LQGANLSELLLSNVLNIRAKSASLKQDLPTSQGKMSSVSSEAYCMSLTAIGGAENSNRSRVDPHDVWTSFRDIIDLSSEIFSTLSQLSFVFQLSRSDYGGPIFGALCISQPLLNLVNARNLWGKGKCES